MREGDTIEINGIKHVIGIRDGREYFILPLPQKSELEKLTETRDPTPWKMGVMDGALALLEHLEKLHERGPYASQKVIEEARKWCGK
jgi:hypothetical protein